MLGRPNQCVAVASAKGVAEDYAHSAAIAAGATSLEDNKWDAMRHAMWNAVMTRTMGTSAAEAWVTAHESANPPNDGAGCMDLFNNAAGRAVGAAAFGQTYPTMFNTVMQMANATPPLTQNAPGC